MLWRYLPLAGIVLLAVIGAVVRPLIQRHRYGTSGIFLFRGGPAQKVRDTLFVALFTGFIFHGIAGARNGPVLRLLVSDASLAYAMLQLTGAALIVSGIILSAAAQLNLGSSWRIGIDKGSAPGLVTGGLYAVSRHPIFLGFLLVFAGFAAMLPTPFSLVLLSGACIGLGVQARAEERHMLATYGDAYPAYAARVGRFFPGVGVLRPPAHTAKETSAP